MPPSTPSLLGARSPDADHHAERTLQVAAEQTRLLYTQAPTNLIVTVLNSAILVAVMHPVVAPATLLVWLTTMLAVTVARALLVWSYHHVAPPADCHDAWRRRFVVGACSAGMVWGSTAIALVPQDSQAHQMFLAFLLGGMITGAGAVLSWVSEAFIAFLVPTALPLVLLFALEGSEVSMAMAALSLIFVGAVVTTSRQLHGSFTESLVLRFDNTTLLHDLFYSECRTAEVNVALREEIAERKRAEEALRAARDQLERRVEERTRELLETNVTLRREINARASAELALQHERDRLEVTLASIGDAVIATDENAVLTFMNPVAETLTGWSARAALGRRLAEVFCIVDERSERVLPSPTERVLRERVATGLTNATLLLARDGRKVPIADSGAPIRGKDGRVHGAVVIFRDVTERRTVEAELCRAKEAAEAADRAKSEFLATMSHELRSPLHVILGYGSLLGEDAFGSLNPEQRDALERLCASARQLHDLISTLLDLSRIDAGRLPVYVAEVRMPDLLVQVRDEVQELQDRSGLEVVWSADEDLAPLHTDAGKLKVVVRNLVGNAIKFTRRGRVAVTAHPLRDGVEIQVEDTGIGIPREALATIFDAFRQVEGTGRSHEGTGLGLHIVKRLVELLGGEVGVESELGRGSTFRVWLPRRRAAPAGCGSDI